MRGTLLSAILLIVGRRDDGMHGQSLRAPRTKIVQLISAGVIEIRTGGGDWDGPMMVCNLDVSPLEACEEMMAYMPPLDWLPFGDWIHPPSCEELYGDLPEGTGSCESSFSLPF